ncbi:hypothetical protein D3C85_1276950 [compost metagenome]
MSQPSDLFCAKWLDIISPALALFASVHHDRPLSRKKWFIIREVLPPTESSAEKRRMISPRIESA